MHDALLGVAHRIDAHAELRTVATQGLDLGAADVVLDRGRCPAAATCSRSLELLLETAFFFFFFFFFLRSVICPDSVTGSI